MIVIDNPFGKFGKWNEENADAIATFDPDSFLNPLIDLQARAYRHGAQAQLAVCIADLRTWAATYRYRAVTSAYNPSGDAMIADCLDAFCNDWTTEMPETAPLKPPPPTTGLPETTLGREAYLSGRAPLKPPTTVEDKAARTEVLPKPWYPETAYEVDRDGEAQF